MMMSCSPFAAEVAGRELERPSAHDRFGYERNPDAPAPLFNKTVIDFRPAAQRTIAPAVAIEVSGTRCAARRRRGIAALDVRRLRFSSVAHTPSHNIVAPA